MAGNIDSEEARKLMGLARMINRLELKAHHLKITYGGSSSLRRDRRQIARSFLGFRCKIQPEPRPRITEEGVRSSVHTLRKYDLENEVVRLTSAYNQLRRYAGEKSIEV